MARVGDDSRILDFLRAKFPGLGSTEHEKTSDATPRYNCIAWAAGDDRRFWWPEPDPYHAHWPSGIPRRVEFKIFRRVFEELGYQPCDSADLEDGLEKVAIFAQGTKPTHAARQLEDGRWTSKMGRNIDIAHELEAVSGEEYGEVALIMQRPRAKSAPG